ncbi:copper type II ascorbate-dependent monooxygenase domain protein [Ancylostoma duodenale]|uniref:Copper type II ascorbate-dependent monooxygenase domain protein n=1 Tax=Ancylostoma duodenale TaxID=51022 RepID=A0A0C2E0R4_9BILA|nr:copper type II ascorbate-dependent monooxygenase domain protein [Ancylostoma duodenale]
MRRSNNLPSGGIHVFGSQLHAHLSGRKIFTSHYRSGVKIGEINRDNHYSPHWQHIVFIRPYIHVMPGGYGIEDEMCVNYIYYFPASEVEVCKSAVDNTTLHTFFEHE